MSERGDPLETAQRLRYIATAAGYPGPDEVVINARELTFVWHEHEVAVIVDLEAEDVRDGCYGVAHGDRRAGPSQPDEPGH